jgi:hypothetical protein
MPGLLENFIIQRIESQRGGHTVKAQYGVQRVVTNVDGWDRILELACRQVALDAPNPKE